MGKPYQYTISFRIRHPFLDPDEISRTLNLNPCRSCRVDDQRMTPRGKLLGGVNRETFWVMEIIHEGDSTTRELSKAIGESLDELASCREFLHRIRADGGNAEFFVGWFFDGNRGDLLNCDLLARLADLRIDLSFDVYP